MPTLNNYLSYQGIIALIEQVYKRSPRQFKQEEMEAIEKSVINDPELKFYIERHPPLFFLELRKSYLLQQERDGLRMRDVHDPLFADLRVQSQAWLQSLPTSTDSIMTMMGSYDQEKLSYYQRKLQEIFSRFKQERIFTQWYKNKTQADEAATDFDDYLNYIFEKYREGATGAQTLIATLQWAEQESDTTTKNDRLLAFFSALNEARIAYAEETDKYEDGHDWSCPPGLEQRLLDTMAIIRQSQESEEESKAELYAAQAINDFLDPKGEPSKFFYSLCFYALLEESLSSQNIIFSEDQSIIPELHIASNEENQGIDGLSECYHNIKQPIQHNLEMHQNDRKRKKEADEAREKKPKKIRLKEDNALYFSSFSFCNEEGFLAFTDQELIERIAKKYNLTSDYVEFINSIVKGGNGITYLRELLFAIESDNDQSIPFVSYEKLKAKLDKIKSTLLEYSLAHLDIAAHSYRRHLIYDQILIGAVAQQINQESISSLRLTCQDALLADVVKQITDMERRHALATLCAAHGFSETLKNLLSGNHAVDRDYSDHMRGSMTLLQIAARYGHASIVEHLLDLGADLNRVDHSARTALHWAADREHLDVTRLLLSAGSDINLRDEHGKSALHYALCRCHLAIVKAFLSVAHPNIKDGSGATALHYAAHYGRVDIIQALLAAGADINLVTHDGMTAVRYAADQGHKDVVEVLLAAGADIKIVTDDGASALHSAADQGHIDIIKAFLMPEADIQSFINLGDQDGWNALHFAASKGHEAIVKILLAAGADINLGTHDGMTALHYAAENGHKEVAQALLIARVNPDLRAHDKMTALHCAADHGHKEIIEVLVAAKANIYLTDEDGMTALHCAVDNSHGESVKALLAVEADMSFINSSDNEGMTALHFAASKGHLDIFNMLLSAGAHLDLRDNDSMTALHCAADQGHKDIIEALVAAKANIYLTDEDGMTALHCAVDNGHRESVKALLAVETDMSSFINLSDNEGMTALHFAASKGHLDIFNMLLSAGANPDLKDHDEMTILHCAVDQGHKKIVQALLALKAHDHAFINLVDKDGWSALHFAGYKGRLRIAQALLAAGAQHDLQDDEGKTALNLAELYAHTSMKELLQEQVKHKRKFR